MRYFVLPLAAALCSQAMPIAAQALPDAGSLQQQIERQRPQRLPPQRSAPEPAATAPEAADSGASVVVQAFRFKGNTLLGDAQLAPSVAPFLGRPLGLAELRQAAAAAAAAYREAGWIVHTWLPGQDIQDGVVTIQVSEARLSDIATEGEPTRVSAATALAYFSQQQPGAPISAPALDRALLLADDLPSLQVSGRLQPGAQDGETQLMLKMSDEPLFSGQVGADNAGSRSTGAARISAQLSLASPLGLGDQWNTLLIHSRGSDYVRTGWSLPAGSSGWRAGINAAHFRYRLVAPEFAALGGKGHSTSLGLEASYPLLRSRQANLYFNAALDRKQFDNRTVSGTTSKYHATNATLGLSGNLYDTLGGGGATSASLAATQGRIALGRPDFGENAALQGGFQKLRYSLARQQALTGTLGLYASLAGQWAGDPLDSSEKFYLGGPSGVRAYPVNEGPGNSGQLANLELRWSLPLGAMVTGFYDWGRVRQDGGAHAPASGAGSYSLKGYGLTLAWQGPSGISVSATWARRQGSNPQATPAGLDQDGSLHKNRWWLNASLRF